jgi:hypothetical protein
MNSNDFSCIPVIYPIRNPTPWPVPYNRLWAGCQLPVMTRACMHMQYWSLCIQWPGIAITPNFKISLLLDPLGHLINMDRFRLIWVQHTFLKLYGKGHCPPTNQSSFKIFVDMMTLIKHPSLTPHIFLCTAVGQVNELDVTFTHRHWCHNSEAIQVNPILTLLHIPWAVTLDPLVL